jgi:hypothetical protein
METDIFTHIKIIIYEVKSVKITKQQSFIIENNLQKVGQSFFHSFLGQQDLFVRCQFSLVQDNRTNVNVDACSSKVLYSRKSF